jgi:hypothetical protein
MVIIIIIRYIDLTWFMCALLSLSALSSPCPTPATSLIYLFIFCMTCVEVWHEWLSDEEKLACTPEQQMQVILLYQRAVKDYLGKKLQLYSFTTSSSIPLLLLLPLSSASSTFQCSNSF